MALTKARSFPPVATPPFEGLVANRGRNAWVLCQREFRNLNMTFEQLLATIAVIRAGHSVSNREG